MIIVKPTEPLAIFSTVSMYMTVKTKVAGSRTATERSSELFNQAARRIFAPPVKNNVVNMPLNITSYMAFPLLTATKPDAISAPDQRLHSGLTNTQKVFRPLVLFEMMFDN